MKNMFISKSNGRTWYQEGPDFLRREYGEHPEDVAIIPSANIVSTDTGKKRRVTLKDLYLHFEKIKSD